MIYGSKLITETNVSGGSMRGFLSVSRILLRMSLLFCVVLNHYSCREHDKVSLAPEITSFGIPGISGKVTIDHDKGIIEMIVPYGTLINDRIPDIKITDGSIVVPATSVAQNFTKPVFYTVTAGDGSKRVYKVVLLSGDQPAPQIVTIAKDTLKAGDSLVVNGKNFGNNAVSLSAIVKEKISGNEVAVPFLFSDSTKVTLLIPATLTSADYYVILVKNSLRAVSQKTIRVRIHEPVVTAIRKQHLIQGDTLVVAGNFIIPTQYKYSLNLHGQTEQVLTPVVSSEGRLAALVTNQVKPGEYTLTVSNTTEKTHSAPSEQKITVYDQQLAYIKEIIAPKADYVAGEIIRFRTANFKKMSARFYTIHLTGASQAYSQNGIFSETDEILSMTIPTGISAGGYKLAVNFLSSSGNSLYEIETDDQIIIK